MVLLASRRLLMADLLHPEAGSGGVEVGEEGEVVVFGGVRRQLDDGRSLLEDLAAAVEDEVVVRGNLCVSNTQRRNVPLSLPSIPLPPVLPQFFACLSTERHD